MNDKSLKLTFGAPKSSEDSSSPQDEPDHQSSLEDTVDAADNNLGELAGDRLTTQALAQIDSAVGDWWRLNTASTTIDLLRGLNISTPNQPYLPISDAFLPTFNSNPSMLAHSGIGDASGIYSTANGVPQSSAWLLLQSAKSNLPFVTDQTTAPTSLLGKFAESVISDSITSPFARKAAERFPFIIDKTLANSLTIENSLAKAYDTQSGIASLHSPLFTPTPTTNNPYVIDNVAAGVSLFAKAHSDNHSFSNSILASLLSPAKDDSFTSFTSGITDTWRSDHRSVIGPISDMYETFRRDSEASSVIKSFGLLLNSFESKFERPKPEQIDLLFRNVIVNSGLSTTDVLLRAKSVKSPWLDLADSTNSISAFANLQGIGEVLRTNTFSSNSATGFLREYLGDWRDEITWTKSYSGDLDGRSSLYLSKGLNPYLTNFPPRAFAESLSLARVVEDAAPDLIEMYGDPLPESTEDEGSDFARTNKAHMLLLRFEFRLRRFIDSKLTDACGSDWVKNKIPPDMLQRWDDKKQKAEKAGRAVRPLIEYADFTDYTLIIQKRDLWPVFEPHFKRVEYVRESFQRLHWPRIEVAHGRPISHDDELFAYVEVKRLGKALWG